MVFGIIILVIVVLIVLWAIGTYNSLIQLRTQVEEGFSTMDVYLKKRFDLIPNLVATVKGYAAHEADTLEKVVAARQNAYASGNKDEIASAEGQLTGVVRNIFALAEQYPNLKADANFRDLQEKLSRIEDDIANARKYYNGCVKIFNAKIQMFPTVIIANMGHFEKFAFFEVTDNAERENVKVEF
ncbi:MAG: LemA family protein [Pseudobutyrivibrio sp.]|nr:LemA family protein [Pseudobutyrivibrio sp.]